MKIALLMPNWIGDAVMALPAMTHLKRKYPQCEFIGVINPYLGEVFSGLDLFSKTIGYQKKSVNKELRFWGAVKKLRQERVDEIILLTNSLRSGLFAWLSGARKRRGYVRSGRRFLLTERYYAEKEDQQWKAVSAVDYYLRLVDGENLAPKQRKPRLVVTDEESMLAEKIWKKFDFGDQKTVVMNAGGAYGSAKHWDDVAFAKLANLVVKQYGANVLFICGPQEKETVKKIVSLADNRKIQSLAEEEVSLSLSKGCIAKSDFVVSTDSGPRHIGAGFGKAAVAIFGPTDPVWSHNYNPNEEIVYHSIGCAPCAKRSCPLGHHDCMKLLQPEVVFKKIEDIDKRLGVFNNSRSPSKTAYIA
ncbi:MAG: lipopolysaccharide heptosyltransferase II [Pirellulaceae bacterium]|nr:lipopolysaccharide heptosyltransferase II [Pirellulaceae bacterium]